MFFNRHAIECCGEWRCSLSLINLVFFVSTRVRSVEVSPRPCAIGTFFTQPPWGSVSATVRAFLLFSFCAGIGRPRNSSKVVEYKKATISCTKNNNQVPGEIFHLSPFLNQVFLGGELGFVSWILGWSVFPGFHISCAPVDTFLNLHQIEAEAKRYQYSSVVAMRACGRHENLPLRVSVELRTVYD